VKNRGDVSKRKCPQRRKKLLHSNCPPRVKEGTGYSRRSRRGSRKRTWQRIKQCWESIEAKEKGRTSSVRMRKSSALPGKAGRKEEKRRSAREKRKKSTKGRRQGENGYRRKNSKDVSCGGKPGQGGLKEDGKKTETKGRRVGPSRYTKRGIEVEGTSARTSGNEKKGAYGPGKSRVQSSNRKMSALSLTQTTG